MKKLLFLSFVALAFLLSCEPEKDDHTLPPTPEQTVKAMQEYVLISKIFSDSFEEANKAAVKSDATLNAQKSSYSDELPIITIEPFDLTTWPKTITADYGTTNYLCPDGRYRRGKLIITASDFYFNQNAEYVVNFENYFHNDYKVEGTQTFKNAGRNNDGFVVVEEKVVDGKITSPEGKIVYFSQNTSRVFIEGEGTITDPCDDVFLVTGTQNGISSDSIAYALSTPTPLNVLVCCKWIRAGVLNVDIQGLSTISINYGEGDCDNQAVISFGGQNYPITME